MKPHRQRLTEPSGRGPVDPAEQIRQTLHQLLDLLAAELARQFQQKSAAAKQQTDPIAKP